MIMIIIIITMLITIIGPRYGQLSGMVEPVFGVIGALCVMVADPLLPYVLSFAAGAMIFVVFDDIIPEAQSRWVSDGRLPLP